MKKTALLFALLLLSITSQAAESNRNSKVTTPIDDMIWCNKFVISISVGQGGASFSISTEILICCTAFHLQTCFTMDPKQPGNFIAPAYIHEMDPKILREIETKALKELTVNTSTSVEIEKSFYIIQKGTYKILKDKKGLYINTVLEKIK